MSIGTIGPGPGANTWEFSAPSESEPKGRLEFPRGAARVTIHATSMPELFRARFWGSPPAVSVERATVTARYPRVSPQQWRRPWDRRGGEVNLNLRSLGICSSKEVWRIWTPTFATPGCTGSTSVGVPVM
jgi:hypothetical protein